MVTRVGHMWGIELGKPPQMQNCSLIPEMCLVKKNLRFWGDTLQNLKLIVKFLKKSQNFYVIFLVAKMGWEHIVYAQVICFYLFGALKQWIDQEIKE